MKNNKNVDKKMNVWWIVLISIIGVLLGIGLILFSFIPQWAGTGIKADFTRTIGGVLIPMSITSLLLDWFGYIRYSQRRLMEILTEDSMLSILSTERKRNMKFQLYQSLYLNDGSCEESRDLVNLIDQEIENILSEYFYSEYIIYVDISPELSYAGNIIYRKDIRKIMHVKPIRESAAKCQFKNPLLFINMDSQLPDSFEIEYLKINGEILTKGNDYEIKTPQIPIEDSSNYSKTYFLNITNDLYTAINDSYEIDLKYTTRVDFSDKIFAITMEKPCKHLCCHFNFDSCYGDLWLKGNGFMSCGDDKKLRIIKTQNGKMIRFLSWTLPGDGVNVFIQDDPTIICDFLGVTI